MSDNRTRLATELEQLLTEARPAIVASGPDPQGRGGYQRGFVGLFGNLDPHDPEFQRLMLQAMAANYRLNHEWWPANREAVLKALQRGSCNCSHAINCPAYVDELGGGHAC